MRLLGSLILLTGVAITTGCTTDPSTPSAVDSGAPVANGGACSFAPAGPVELGSGQQQTFIGDFPNCSGTFLVTITPSNAEYGFTSGTDCDLKQVSAGLLFKIRACEGNLQATVTIQQGGSTIQTIELDAL